MKGVSEMLEVNEKRLRTLFFLELSHEVCALTVQKA